VIGGSPDLRHQEKRGLSPSEKRGTIENAAPSRRSRPAITRPLVLGSSSLQPPARVPRAKYRTPPASVARRRPRHQTASQGGRQRVLPSSVAISALLLPVAGMTTLRSNTPGCLGHRVGSPFAQYSVID